VRTEFPQGLRRVDAVEAGRVPEQAPRSAASRRSRTPAGPDSAWNLSQAAHCRWQRSGPHSQCRAQHGANNPCCSHRYSRNGYLNRDDASRVHPGSNRHGQAMRVPGEHARTVLLVVHRRCARSRTRAARSMSTARGTGSAAVCASDGRHRCVGYGCRKPVPGAASCQVAAGLPLRRTRAAAAGSVR